MSFRARIAIAAAAAVALAVVLISVVVFFVVRDQLRSQVDEALNNRADQIAHIRDRLRVGRRGASRSSGRGSASPRA